MKKFILFALCSIILVGMAGPAAADPDPEIPIVFTLNQTRIPGRYWFKYALFDTDGEGDPGVEVWYEEMDLDNDAKRPVKNKKLRHLLGSIAEPVGPLNPALFSEQLWAQAFRWKTRIADWVPCSKRVKLKVQPYALFSSASAGAGDIAPDSVNSSHIVNNSVTSADIQNGTIQGIDIAGGAVGSGQIEDGSVAGIDIQNGTIQGVDIQDGTIGGGDILNGSIKSIDIQDGTITGADIATGTIASVDIQDGTITNTDISADAYISPSKISGTAARLNFTGTQSFDGGTLRIDSSSNSVGINTAPDEALDVSGNVAVSGNYTFSSAKYYWYAMHVSAFVTDSSEPPWYYFEDYGFLSGSSSIALYAPVNLPENATVTNFECHFQDISATQDVTINAYLYRRYYSQATSELMGFVSGTTTGSSDDIIQIYDTSIDYDQIDNGSYIYSVKVLWDPTGTTSQLRFYDCWIQYGVSILSP